MDELVQVTHMDRLVSSRAQKAKYGPTFIKEWRLFRRLTLESLADEIAGALGGFTHASLSRIENGKQPYSQPILEALADALDTDVGSLLMRDPTESENLWAMWRKASPKQRKDLLEIAKTVLAPHN